MLYGGMHLPSLCWSAPKDGASQLQGSIGLSGTGECPHLFHASRQLNLGFPSAAKIKSTAPKPQSLPCVFIHTKWFG